MRIFKIAALFVIALLFNIKLSAQNTIAELHFETAEKAYNAGNYMETLAKLDDVEKLTGLMSKTLYLRIVSQDKLADQLANSEEDNAGLLRELQSNVGTYLEVMADQGLDDRYREVYTIQEKITERLEFAEWGEMSEYKKGRAAAESENYAEALDWYKQAAEKGNARAVNNIGVLYARGQGVDQDYGEAMKYYKNAAEMGLAMSMSNIGNLYVYGNGVAPDHNEALRWFKKSAKKGNTEVFGMLGYLHMHGHGVTQDYNEAFYWYKRAADSGNVNNMNTVGTLYSRGLGVDQDYKEAMKWYKKAVEKGYAGAMSNIGLSYYHGYGVGQDYVKAMEWYKKAHEAEESPKNKAQIRYIIANMYEEGLGVKKDKKTALEWRNKP